MKGVNMTKKTKKRIKIAVGMIAALMIAGCAGGSIFVGKLVADGLLYQNKGNDTKGNSIKQLEEWNYDLDHFKEQYGGLASEINVEAEDGNEVPAEVFQTGENSHTVILVHGHGGDHVFNYMLAEMYLSGKWNVITYDQRGAGDNPDDKVTFGYAEKLDVKALVDYAKEKMNSDKIVVHGQSMGAATAGLYAATEHAEKNVDAVVLDSVFDNMKNMFLGVWRGMDTEGIPEDYVVACGDWYLRQFYGFGFEDADVEESMKENHVKTLMLQMEQDDVISAEKAAEMFDNIASEEKEIKWFDCGHIEGIYKYPEEYKEAVFSFLDEQ